MRPALTVVVDGHPTRLLADLMHKPWAAEDGEPWTAAFPYSLESTAVLDAELTVAPDLTIALPAPQERPGPRKVRPSSPPRAVLPAETHQPAAGVRLAPAEDPRRLRQQIERLEYEREQTAARMDELLGKLSLAAREREEARAQRDELAAERDELRRELDQVAAERNTAVVARDQAGADRRSARAERDESLRATEAAQSARDRALTERGAALAAQARAVSERDAAVAARDQAAAERRAALALRDHALAERDAALAAREDAHVQLETLSRMNARLQSQLTHHLSSEGAAMVMRRAAQEGPVSRPYHRMLAGAVITIVALVALVALLILARL